MTRGSFRVVSALLFACLVLAVWLAVSNLQAIAEAPLLDIAVPPAAVSIDGDLLRGELSDGLPPYELHWDGQPPAAVLVDAARATVLAAAAFSDQTFDRNRNAVRFTSGRARFVLDARRWTPGQSSLILRLEAVRSRRPFYVWSITALGLATAMVVLFAVRRYGACPIPERRTWLQRSAEALAFVLIAIGVFATSYPGVPVRVAEVTDEANINSFAAALDRPERFALDKHLSNPDHFAWYTPVYIDLIRGARRLGFHYATGEAFIGAALTLILLFGFRRLLATVTGSPGFAFAAALGLGLMFDQTMPPPGEYWSILTVTPRMLFTAFVPWALLLAIRVAPFSRRWWIAAGVAGLLFHIHPLSAPVLVGAILVAFVVASEEPWPARVLGAVLASAAAVATMLPYVIVYAVRYGQTVDVDAATATRTLELIRAMFRDLEPSRLLRDLLVYRVTSFRILLDGLALLVLVRRPFDRASRFYAGLALGFVIVTFGVPALDGAAAEYLHRRPFEFEMARGVRFIDLFAIGALALAVRDWRRGRRVSPAFVAAVTVSVLVSLGPGWFRTVRSMAGRDRLSWRILNGRPDPSSGAAMEVIRAVQALRARDERVSGPVGLRQFDVPLAWLSKDVISLSYSRSSDLIEAAETTARSQPFLAQTVTEQTLGTLSSMLGAQVFLLRRGQIDELLARSSRVLFVNDVYAVVRAANPATVRARPNP